MKTCLEIFVASFDDNESIIYSRTLIDITSDTRNPDELVKEAISMPVRGIPELRNSDFISHSTSWRHESDGTIYLTYVVFANDVSFGGKVSDTLSVSDMRILKGSAADTPRPENIKEAHVISHGMRHIAHLVNESGHENYRDALNDRSLALLASIGTMLAGKL